MEERPKPGANRTVKQLIGDGARVLPEKSHGWFRRWFRKVWKVRGSGLYALGFAVTFIYLEVGSLSDDLMGIGSLFNGQAIEFVIQFFIDSFSNTLKAFIWPVFVAQLAPPWGAVGLGLVFVGFTRYLKAPLEKWMFADAPEASADAE